MKPKYISHIMEDLSNSGIIGGLISLLLGVIGTVFGLYKNSESARNKERTESMQQLLKQAAESEAKTKNAYEAQVIYQQNLINDYKNDLDELQEKYYELGSTLQPALSLTNKTLEDIGRIIQKLIDNGIKS